MLLRLRSGDRSLNEVSRPSNHRKLIPRGNELRHGAEQPPPGSRDRAISVGMLFPNTMPLSLILVVTTPLSMNEARSGTTDSTRSPFQGHWIDYRNT
jgi:hypothetical protein